MIHFGGLSTKTRKMKSIIEGYRGSLYISRKFYPLPIHYLFRILLLVDLFPKLIFYGLFSLINRKKLEQLKAYMIILKINATGEFPKP